MVKWEGHLLRAKILEQYPALVDGVCVFFREQVTQRIRLSLKLLISTKKKQPKSWAIKGGVMNARVITRMKVTD